MYRAFCIGQKVIVNLPEKQISSSALGYPNPGLMKEMYKLNGKVVTIKSKGNIYSDGYSNYNIAEDKNCWAWNERWFKKAKKSNMRRW